MRTQRLSGLTTDTMFPQLARLPRAVQKIALRAYAPSIDSKLAWSICMKYQDLSSACCEFISFALTYLRDLTSVSFCLSMKASHENHPEGQLDSKKLHHLHNIVASICKLPCLTSLMIDIRGIASSSIVSLVDALPAARWLDVLQMQCSELQEDAASAMLKSLPQLSPLHCLSLYITSELSQTSAHIISDCIALLTTICSLHLSCPCSTSASAAQALNSIAAVQLRTLTLNYHFSQPVSLPDSSLARAIGRATSLQDLAISTNVPLPGFGQQLLEHCTTLGSLKRLRISGAMQESCAESFGQFLHFCSLNELKVAGVPTHRAGVGATAASQGMCGLPVSLYGLQLLRMDQLTSLDLSDTSAAALCAGGVLQTVLPQLSCLFHLKLVNWADDITISDSAMRQLAAAIAKVPVLNEVHMSGGLLAVHLTPLFYQMTRLQKAVLFGRIPWAARPLLSACSFDSLSKLTDIRLIGNGAPPSVISAFADVLAGMKRLEVLILSYQKFDIASAACLAGAMWPQGSGMKRQREQTSQCDGLEELYMLGLGGCGMDASTLDALRPALCGLAGCKLTHALLWGNDTEAAVIVSSALTMVNPGILIDSDGSL